MRKSTRPIENLLKGVREISNGNYGYEVLEKTNKDEIGDMVNSLNQLLDSFQKSYQETVLSSQKMQTTAHKLLNLADEIDSRESMHKFEDNYESVHEKTEEIKDASDGLAELSARLQVLSRQFKVFEEESDRANSGW